MSDVTNPERVERTSIIVPKKASQLFGAYLRQEFKGPLDAIGKPQNQRLFNFIDNLETSREVKLVRKGRLMNFEFSKEKDNVTSTVSNFVMNKDITPHFVQAIDHNVRNALQTLVAFDDKRPFRMTHVLISLSNAAELKMLRDKDGTIKIIPL